MLGMCLPIDLIARYLPEKVRWATKIPLWFVVLVYSYHSIYTYFYDYVKFPNL